MATKNLDPGNVIKQVYDESTEALKTTIAGSTAPVEVTATTPLPVVLSGSLDNEVILSQEIDFSSIPDSSSAPYEISASLSSDAIRIMVYDTTGVTTQIRVGAGVGTLLALVGPGQDQPLDVKVAAGSRVSIRSNGAAPTAGTFIINIIAQI